MSQERTEQVFEESSDRGKEGQIEIRVTRDTWMCNDCGFEMNAEHYNADSPEGCWEYDCPVCENEELESEIDRLNAENAELEKATLAHMDYIRVIEPAKEAWKKRAKVYRHEMYEGKSKSRYEIDCLMVKVQERDETIKEWERRFGNRTNTAWKALGAAHAEVKRRADQVEERDKEIQQLEKEKQMYAEGLEQKRIQLYEKDEQIEQLQLDQNFHVKEIERLSWSNGEQVKEIERLRAEAKEREKELSQLRPAYDQMLESLEYAHEALGDAYEASPEGSAVQGITFLAYDQVGEALKGAE